MKYLSLFTGVGGWDLGLNRAGLRCVGQVEIEPLSIQSLAHQFPESPRWSDIRTFSGNEINEHADVIAASFPCQDLSTAGGKRGIRGERSGLFYDVIRIVRRLEPDYLVMENVAGLLDRGMGDVLGALADIGFDAEWQVLSAARFGADHLRRRAYIVAYPQSRGRPLVLRGVPGVGVVSHPAWGASDSLDSPVDRAQRIVSWLGEPALFGSTYGFPAKVAEWQLGAYGNAVFPQVAEWIGRRIMDAAREAVPA